MKPCPDKPAKSATAYNRLYEPPRDPPRPARLRPAPVLTADAQTANTKAASPSCTEPLLDTCAAFPFESLPIRYSTEGALTHQILEGRIPGTPNPAGNVIELHETTLKPGKTPHPPHRHPHAELLLVRTGIIEFLSDNPPVPITAGGAAFCAPGRLHGFRNVGEIDATYFILKIGAEPVCQK